ncbi:MAG: endonuclease/exonuclease/phosphatase family protein [Planctomycetota bacterium]|nr:endonuclease/exonuclease/phosphatase family protein [Planctomycetota bacterium]
MTTINSGSSNLYFFNVPSVLFLLVTCFSNIRAEDSIRLDGPLTVLNYNVYNGFRGGKSYKEGVQWVNTVAPDIAAWQELVGWNEKRLQANASQWKHPYAATLKGGGYNIGLSSRKEIEVINRRTMGFWHGYLHCRTYGIDIIVCHLWPGSRREQIKEAAQLCELVQKLAGEGKQVILMGDFNAHIKSDANWLNKQRALIERRLPSDRKKPLEDRFIVDNQWNFDVMDKIMEAPLTDLVGMNFARRVKSPTYEQLVQLGSFPTRVLNHVNTEALQRGFLERIDFILATPELSKLNTEAQIVREPDVLERISDHYPVIAKFGKP